MKIAIIVSTRPNSGGLNNYINTIVPPLREAGHVVDVVSLFGKSRKVGGHDKLTNRLCGVIKRWPITVLFFYIISKVLILFYLWRNHRRRRYDVFFAMAVPCARIAQRFTRKGRHTLVLRVGGIMVADMLSRGWIRQNSIIHHYFLEEQRKAYSASDLVVANSVERKRYVLELCPNANVVEPIGNPVDSSFKSCSPEKRSFARKQLSFPENTFIMLCPSLHLETRKGPMVALRAALELISSGLESFLLVFLGGGPEEKKMRIFAEKHALTSKLLFPGIVTPDQMRIWYNAVDLVLFPVVSGGGMVEDSSNCVLESMASGTPVVVTAFGSFKNLIKDGLNGFLVSENAPNELANKIRTFHDNPEMRRFMSIEALRTIERGHRAKPVIVKLQDLFQKTLD